MSLIEGPGGSGAFAGSDESQGGVLRFKEAPMGDPGLESRRGFARASFEMGGEGVLAGGLLEDNLAPSTMVDSHTSIVRGC